MTIMPVITIGNGVIRHTEEVEITKGVSKRFDKAKIILENRNGEKTNLFGIHDVISMYLRPIHLMLGGIDGYVNVPHHTSLDFSGTSTFSLFAEIKTTDTGTRIVIGKIAGSNNYLPGYALAINNGRIRGIVTKQAGAIECIVESTNTRCNDGKWHVIGMTWGGVLSDPSTMKLYMDGKEITDRTVVANTLYSGTINHLQDLQIGTVTGVYATWGYLRAGVKFCHVFNTSLPAAQVLKLYTSGVVAVGTANLVGLWKLESNAQDSSPSANHGTLTGGAQFLNNYNLLSGGVDGYMETSTTAGLDFYTNNPFSVFAEIVTNDTNLRIIVAKVEGSSNALPGYSLQINNGKIRASIVLQEYSGLKCIVESTNTRCNDGETHFIGFTYSGSLFASGLKLYMDGKEVTDRTVIADTMNAINTLGPGKLSIGHITGSYSFGGYYPGRVKNAMVFNAELTAAQVKNLYECGVKAVGTSNLAGHWKLESDTQDSSVNANHGTLYGGAVLDKSDTLFRGLITATKPLERHQLEITAQDYTGILASREVDESYDNQTIYYIITNATYGIIPKYLPSITTNNVSNVTKTVSRKFQRYSVLEVLIYLADIAAQDGYDFFVDDAKDLHFFASKTIGGGITIRDTAPANLLKWEYPNEGTVIYNRITVQGNPELPSLAVIEDATSQSKYGIRDMPVIIDPSILTLDDAQSRANRELKRYANPVRVGILTSKLLDVELLRPGYTVNVNINKSGVASGAYVIMEMTFQYPKNRAIMRVNEWGVNFEDILSSVVKEMRRTSSRIIDTDSINFEKYDNHNGTVDNFLQTLTSGNGTATTDAANHRMTIHAGSNVAGYAIYKTKKAWSLSKKPILINILQNNFLAGNGANYMFIGLKSDFTTRAGGKQAGFYYYWATGWKAITLDLYSSETPVTINNDDKLTIVATSERVVFLINGKIVANHTVGVPAGALYIGAAAYIENISFTGPQTSIDLLSFKVY